MTIPAAPTTEAPPAPADPNAAAAAPAAAGAQAPAAAAPAAPVEASVTLTQAQLQAMIAQAVNAGMASVPGTVPAGPAAVPEPPTSPENLFEKGQLVSYTYVTPYDGQVTRHGLVLDTLPDEGAGARSTVAWFHDVSGPIGDHLLAAG